MRSIRTGRGRNCIRLGFSRLTPEQIEKGIGILSNYIASLGDNMDLEINGINCHYEQVGEGKDLLLLHGWGGCIDSWLPVTEHFKQNCRVTVIDFPGHGKSGFPPEEGWTVDDYCTFTAAFIEQTISGCDIIATASAGAVALLLAATRPELIGAAADRCGGTAAQRSKSYYLQDQLLQDHEEADLPDPQQRRAAKKAFALRLGGLQGAALLYEPPSSTSSNQDLAWCLPKVKAETLLIWGRNDTATPVWMGQQMERRSRVRR